MIAFERIQGSSDHVLDKYAYVCPTGRYLRKVWSTTDHSAWICMSPLQAHVLSQARYVCDQSARVRWSELSA